MHLFNLMLYTSCTILNTLYFIYCIIYNDPIRINASPDSPLPPVPHPLPYPALTPNPNKEPPPRDLPANPPQQNNNKLPINHPHPFHIETNLTFPIIDISHRYTVTG